VNAAPTLNEVIAPTAAGAVIATTPTGISVTTNPLEYIVQPGDTLFGIAQNNGISLDALLALNEFVDPNLLTIGQVILIPGTPSLEAPSFQIMPDYLFVRGPGSIDFSIQSFLSQQPGYIRNATDLIDGRLLSASEVIARVSMEFSVDPRILLAILEHRSKWLSNSEPEPDWATYPIQGEISNDGIDRSGLYRQLAWTANQLNRGYYQSKYSQNLTRLTLNDGTELRFSSELNAASKAIQYIVGLLEGYPAWITTVSEIGLARLYAEYFGNPVGNQATQLVPQGLIQPELTLPFSQGETWFFTGGPHGGWGSGSAWSAVDFAPPDDIPEGSALCYVSEFWATAVAPGVIARSDEGSVILDLDGDGDETTGWTIFYLHIADDRRIEVGTSVRTGDQIGRPSCEGGFSTATHMHIGRRYNGEWLPADCRECPAETKIPNFVMSNWGVAGIPGQEYQGFLISGNEQRTAEQGRISPINRISW
jgi:murein DD-endopeptidase MepM/ murein hydrolase activator NlpD